MQNGIFSLESEMRKSLICFCHTMGVVALLDRRAFVIACREAQQQDAVPLTSLRGLGYS